MSAFQESLFEHDSELEDYEDSEIRGTIRSLISSWTSLT